MFESLPKVMFLDNNRKQLLQFHLKKTFLVSQPLPSKVTSNPRYKIKYNGMQVKMCDICQLPPVLLESPG